MRFTLTGTAILAAALALTSNAAFADDEIKQPVGPWTHDPSGTVFPDRVMGMTRSEILDADGDDNIGGATYTLKNSDGLMTLDIIVYRSNDGKSCNGDFGDISDAKAYEGATSISYKEEELSPPLFDRNGTGIHARYSVPENGIMEGYPAAISDIMLYCPADTPWRIQYSADWFGSEDTMPDIEPVVEQVTLPDTAK